jgi:hypothetical protein
VIFVKLDGLYKFRGTISSCSISSQGMGVINADVSMLQLVKIAHNTFRRVDVCRVGVHCLWNGPLVYPTVDDHANEIHGISSQCMDNR